jgi:hypothetical protein
MRRVKFTKRSVFAIVMVTFSLLTGLGSIAGLNSAVVNFVPTVNGATGTATIGIPTNGAMSVTSRTIAITSGGGNLTLNPTRPSVTAAGSQIFWSGLVGDTNNGLSDIDGVTIYIYKSPVSAPITTSTFNASKAYAFRWVRKGYNVVTSGDACSTGTGSPAGCFQELTGSKWSNTLNYLSSSLSTRPTWSGAGPQSGTWSFAATLAQNALYTDNGAPNHWNYELDVTQKSGSHAVASRTGTLDMNVYQQMTVPDTNFNINLASATPGAANESMGTVTWSYSSNQPMNVNIIASGDANSTVYGGTPDLIPIANFMVGTSSTASGCSATTCLKLSTSTQPYATNMLAQISPSLSMYWYISPPNPVVPGTYTFTYTVTMAWNNVYPS